MRSRGRASVVVVGAGVIGAATALELVERGHTVTLLDPGPVPHPEASSTDTSKAVRADYGDDDVHTELARASIEGWLRWNRDWEFAPFHPCGFLLLTRDRIEPGSLEADSLARHRAAGLEPRRFDPASLAESYPMFGAGAFSDGYLSPGAGYAESARVVEELVRRAVAAGATLRSGALVVGLLERATRVEGVVLEGGTAVRADTTVVAAGAWTPALVPGGSGPTGSRSGRATSAGPGGTDSPRLPTAGSRSATTARVAASIPRPRARRTRRSSWPPAGSCVRRSRNSRTRRSPGRGSVCTPIRGTVRSRSTAIPIVPDWSSPRAAAGSARVVEELVRRAVAAGGSGHGVKFAPVLGAIVADRVDGAPAPRHARFAWRPRGVASVERARSREDDRPAG